MAAHGWIGMTWPVELGGGGRPPIERLIVGEELIAAGAPIAAMWFADRQMGPTLIAFGAPDQQAEFLPGILSGETTWCIGMCEPEAGSDLAALRTQARRDGDDWVINGQKIWTSFGAVADYCYLICRTSTDGSAAPGHQRDHRPDATARHRGPADHRHDDEPPLLRGLLHRRAGAGREPRRHRGRRLQADDAPARARARRHRPAGVQPGAVPAGPRPRRHDRSGRAPGDRRDRDRLPDRADPRRSARCWARPPPASRRRRSASAPSTSGGWPSSSPASSAPRRRCGTTSRSGLVVRARLHDHGRHIERDAQHPRASACSACPTSLADSALGRTWVARVRPISGPNGFSGAVRKAVAARIAASIVGSPITWPASPRQSTSSASGQTLREPASDVGWAADVEPAHDRHAEDAGEPVSVAQDGVFRHEGAVAPVVRDEPGEAHPEAGIESHSRGSCCSVPGVRSDMGVLPFAPRHRGTLADICRVEDMEQTARRPRSDHRPARPRGRRRGSAPTPWGRPVPMDRMIHSTFRGDEATTQTKTR